MKLIIKKKYRDMFPRPNDETYGAMREDIRANGQHIPIYHNKKGIILDGYTRYDITRDLKIEPITKLKDCINEVAEIDFIMSMNTQRRDLSVGQKILAYLDYYNELKKERRYRYHTKWEFTSNEIIQKRVGCGHSSVSRVIYILKRGTKKEIQDLKNGAGLMTLDRLITNRLKIKNEKEFIETSTLTQVNETINENKQRIPCPECGGTGKIII